MKKIKDDTGLWDVWSLIIKATPRNVPITGINPKTIEAMRKENLIRDSDTDVYFADCAYEIYRIIENTRYITKLSLMKLDVASLLHKLDILNVSFPARHLNNRR